MHKIIDSKVYDAHILAQGMQFQIERYYEPKEKILKRRVEAVLKASDIGCGDKILDIGCGVGTFAYHAGKGQAQAVGIDYSQESIFMAQKIIARFNLQKKISFVAADAMRLPFKEMTFDKVIAADFIEHITDGEKEGLLKEIHRVLKPGGRGVIFTPNKIREEIGAFYWKIRHIFLGEKIPKTDLHFGLTSKFRFEPLLKKCGFKFKLRCEDVSRPYLAMVPLIKYLISLELLWIIKKI